MNVILHPTYFPNIAHCIALFRAKSVHFEVCDNYQKQTYRNRTEIYAANGKLALTIPVNYTQKNRQLYKDVKIANENNWQSLHLKSLQSAYSMSPFFEYYIDDLIPLFTKKHNYLLDLNFECFEVLKTCLQIRLKSVNTTVFEKEPMKTLDYRGLVKKNNPFTFQPYTQVFSEKLGFISNLSILDLLFNEGPNSELYLKKQTLKLC